MGYTEEKTTVLLPITDIKFYWACLATCRNWTITKFSSFYTYIVTNFIKKIPVYIHQLCFVASDAKYILVGLVHLPFYSFSYTNVLPKSPKGNITVTELGPSFSAGYMRCIKCTTWHGEVKECLVYWELQVPLILLYINSWNSAQLVLIAEILFNWC